jgi:hypothetical protein
MGLGDVVRIAPNELVFIAPKAASGTTSKFSNYLRTKLKKTQDIYGTNNEHIEHFHKTNFIDLGAGDQGLTWERDPVKHRQTSKIIAPAFSVKSIKAKEATIHKYIGLFVQEMKTLESKEKGTELRRV